MRVHTRIFLRRVFGIDDWFIVFAMVSKDLVSEKPSLVLEGIRSSHGGTKQLR